MYKYFKELEKKRKFETNLGVPIDYFYCKSYYDKYDDIILLSDGKLGRIYKWPDAWFITPNGYLYNTGSGHKQGNLIYPYNHIYESFMGDKNLVVINNNEEINNILKRNYITWAEFRNFSNLPYTFPSVLTKENMYTIDFYNTISNDEKLITLIIGHLAAENALYNSFIKINQSNNKKEIIKQINKMDITDILVRFSGFNKVETSLERTITTSSLNSIREFNEYLKKGWNLHIIPGVIYNPELDKLIEVDFDTPIINRYLDNELNNYHGKGNVIIRHKTF